MSGQAERILGRFPAHLEAGDSSKQLFHLVSDLALPLAGLTLEVGDVRRSHRLGDAQVLTDALRLAAFHGLGLSDFEALTWRFDRAARLGDALAEAPDDDARDRAAADLLSLWGLAAESSDLAVFDPGATRPEDADLEVARDELLAASRARLTLSWRLDAIEKRVAAAAALHATGNGTVRALLAAAANLLDLEVVEILHSEDRLWHAATVQDRLRLERRVRDPEQIRSMPLQAATEVIGLEENPRRRRETGREGRRHGHLFSTLRKGFASSLLQIRISGIGDRTLGPMLINRDEGKGVGYRGPVAAGATLVFTEEGRALLDGSDVTADCYSFSGACFAGDDASRQRDFVFARVGGARVEGKQAGFVVADPAGSLGSGASFPHAGLALDMPAVAVGETRFACFVRAAHFAAGPEPPGQIEPGPFGGVFDRSVFDPGALDRGEASALVELSWLEHEAYAVRLLLPQRWRNLEALPGMEGPEFRPITEIVKSGLARFKPAGVEVRVEYVDERWVLGRGVLASEEGADPIECIRSGIRLWPAEEDSV